jgi:hypothetical protein
MAKQSDLPTMEDRRISALEEAGAEYAEIRDERIKLNQREAELKKRVRSMMHKHNKAVYESAEILIELEPPDGEEKVKVKLKKQKAEEPPVDVAD